VPRWRVRFIGFVLIAAFGWSAITCADTPPPAAMKMDGMICTRSHDAPSSEGKMTCCSTSNEERQSTAAKLLNSAPPQLQLVRLVDHAPVVLVIQVQAKRLGESYAPRPLQLDTPTYLLDSVFLL